MNHGLLARSVLVALCLLGASVAIGRASRTEVTPTRESLATFPMRVGSWVGQSSDRFDQRILTVLGVDEYVSRIYSAPALGMVGVYIGYYQSQREGDTMHSPLNCLPGAGWLPVSRSRVTLQVKPRLDERTRMPTGDRTIEVNRIVIEKGLDRQVVIYWYQSHGRVVASEYWGKIYTVLDAIRLNRTDAAMIRIICPVPRNDPEGDSRAERAVTAFTEDLFPLLDRYLPD